MGSQIRGHEGHRSAPMTRALSVADGVPGLDVSSHDGAVDWAARWASGYRFAWVKATEGASYTNPLFSTQYGGAETQGLLHGGYHFAIPSASSGADQAKFFSDHGGGWSADGETLPGALDLEYNPYGGGDCYGMSQTQMAAWITDFNGYYVNRWGRYPIIYTSTSWWNQCVGSSFASTNALWIARYGSGAVGSLPAGWSAHTVWQHSDIDYDQDLFNGTTAELASFAVSTTPPGDDAVPGPSPAPSYSTSGPIGAKYEAVKAILGAPAGAMVSRPDGGSYQVFRNGVITYSPATGAHEFHGAVLARWQSLGLDAAFSRLGYATGDGNASVPFTRGGIINNPGRGYAYIVGGAIWKEFQAIGGTRAVGLPKSDEVDGRGGGVRRMSWFEAGAITWGTDGKALAVRGAIYQIWTLRGSETSRYGRPITDEYASGSQTRQDFSNKYTLISQGGAVSEVRTK